MDWLDTIRVMDDVVTSHLGDDGVLTHEGIAYPVRGPFDRIYVEEGSGEARSAVLKASISVQSHTVPKDPRNGTLTIRGETLKVVDYDDEKDGRITLIMDLHAAT